MHACVHGSPRRGLPHIPSRLRTAYTYMHVYMPVAHAMMVMMAAVPPPRPPSLTPPPPALCLDKDATCATNAQKGALMVMTKACRVQGTWHMCSCASPSNGRTRMPAHAHHVHAVRACT